jgi:hypothetical protein
MRVAHWPELNSLGYRSAWQRLQWTAYKVAPERDVCTTGVSGVARGPAETIGLFTTQVAPANIARPAANSRGLKKPSGFVVFIGLESLLESRAGRPASIPDEIHSVG